MDIRRGLATVLALLSVVLGACTITGEDYETDTPVAKRLQERLGASPARARTGSAGGSRI